MNTQLPDLPRIFVSIASYRDPETGPTLEDLFAKATQPQRVFAGVCWQAAPGVDDACMTVPASVPRAQLRGIHLHPSQSLGACWARHRILTELRGEEEFVLQIDSHMRFVEGWDERMLAMWRQCDNPRALLSHYPVAYTPPDQLGAPSIPLMTANKFNHRGILMPLARSLNYALRPPRPLANPFLSAGFLFAPAKAFDEVPYDPKLYFIGEEISMAARLWTHAWDAYTPNDVLIYHYYGKTENRPRHWGDNPDWPRLDAQSLARIRHLFGIEISSDPAVLENLDRYGLGTARSFEEYERYADVDLRRQVIGPAARCGRYAPHPHPQRLARERCFSAIFRDNSWKAWETRSGSGSTLEATQGLRRSLRAWLQDAGIRSLIDAGCGDVNWMADLCKGWCADLGTEGAQYLGLEIVPALTAQNDRLLGHLPGVCFKSADVCEDRLPDADAILCRNVLSHLPNADILAALHNFRASPARWLLLTSHDGVANNADTRLGVWRPIDLQQAPFSLPPPQERIADGKGRWLGLWSREQFAAG